MRSKFPGYFLPKKSEFDDLWKRGLVVPDANILLHLLRFRRETRDEILKTLKALKSQLWLPWQAAFEFSRKWREVEEEHRGSYDKLKTTIISEGASLCKLFDGVAKFQIVDAAAEKTKVEKFVKELCKSVDDASKKHPTFLESEKVIDEIEVLFSGSTGELPADEIIAQWKNDAISRYAQKIPPGYKDDKKEGDDKYGDYIIFREMMEVAKSRKLPVLFLSDDRKEDWALIREGQDKGARPEVMQEFWEQTGQRFYSYPLNAFLERAKEYTKVAVSKEAIKDVEIQARQRKERLKEDEAATLRALRNFENHRLTAQSSLDQIRKFEADNLLTSQATSALEQWKKLQAEGLLSTQPTSALEQLRLGARPLSALEQLGLNAHHLGLITRPLSAAEQLGLIGQPPNTHSLDQFRKYVELEEAKTRAAGSLGTETNKSLDAPGAENQETAALPNKE